MKFTNEMSAKFSSLVHDVFLNFKRRNVNHERIVIYASTFRVASSEIPYQLLPKEYIDQLCEATSVKKVFTILGGYWDFQNYHLLGFLVQKLGNDAVNGLVREYKKEFLVYQRNVKLLEFVAALPECGIRQEKIDSDKMVVKLPRSWPEASLECVEECLQKLTKAFGIPLHVIRFDAAEEGSIVLTWFIPSSLSPVIRTASVGLSSELEVVSVSAKKFMETCMPTEQIPVGGVSVTSEISRRTKLEEPVDTPPPTERRTMWQRIRNFFRCGQNLPRHPNKAKSERSTPNIHTERLSTPNIHIERLSTSNIRLSTPTIRLSTLNIHTERLSTPDIYDVLPLMPVIYNEPLSMSMPERSTPDIYEPPVVS